MLNFYFENFYPFLLNETGWRISGGGGDLDSTCTSLHLLAGSNDAKNLPDSLRIGIHDLPKKRWLHSDPSHYSEFMQGRHCTNCSLRARLLGLQWFVSVAKSVCSFARAVKTKGWACFITSYSLQSIANLLKKCHLKVESKLDQVVHLIQKNKRRKRIYLSSLPCQSYIVETLMSSIDETPVFAACTS